MNLVGVRGALALMVVGIVSAWPGIGSAQGWSWPAEPENLQVLEGYDGEQLGPVMRGFTRALGVRCNHCHVGEDGQPLSSFDFVSDANPNKDRAREMLRMVASIEGHLAKIEPSGPARVEVGCATCHRGLARPLTLAAELGERYASAGVDATLERYAQLKERHYGTDAYDFGAGSLDLLGHERLAAEDLTGALAIFELNTREHPESARAWDSLATAVLASGDRERAKELFRKSLEIEPRNRHARQQLEALEAQ